MKKLLLIIVISISFIGIGFSQSVTVQSPNGGESWELGSSHQITWTSTGVSGNIKLILLQNGTKLGNIVTDLPVTSSPYAWTVGSHVNGTATAGSGFTIKIRAQQDGLDDYSNGPFTITESGGDTPPDWGWLKDKLRRYRYWKWEPIPFPGPGPGPGPCLSCPPDFNFDRIRELIKEMGLKEQVTVEIVKGGEVFGKAVIGENGRGIRRFKRTKVMPKLRMAKLRKFSEAKGKTLRTGIGFKLVIKNSKGQVIAENGIKLKEMAARR